MDRTTTREMISALADGQLQGDAFAQGVDLCANDREALEAWQAYHLIGDVLRSGDLASGTAPSLFLSRMQDRLKDEPAPQPQLAAAPVVRVASDVAANDGSFRWKVVAGFASVAAVAAIGWTVVGTRDKPEGAQLARAAASGTTVLTGTQQGMMIRDARLDELMAAHRQLGGGSALQTPAGFLRNATFDAPAGR